jgi:flagellar biosynthesis protein FliQ
MSASAARLGALPTKKEIEMDPASAIDFARSSMLVLLEIIAPSMLTALVIGLGIGLLQAVTQIQEQTLAFVPKIVASFVVLLLALPFAGAAMSGLMTDIARRIAAY